jgi:hypothetical protein
MEKEKQSAWASVRRFTYGLHWIRIPLVIVAFLSFVPACAEREGVLTGEVFIVTREAQNIKLGLVTVAAVPEDSVKKHVEKKAQFAASQRKKLDDALRAARTAEASARKERDSMANFVRALAGLDMSPNSDQSKAKEGIDSDFAARTIQLREAEAAREYLDSELYFTDLPPSVAAAKTNADGIFNMTLPRNRRFALAARGERLVGGDTEKYFWLIWVSLEGKSANRVLLSNHNLTTVASPEGVLSFPR